MRLDDIEDIYELSPLQQGMLFHCLLAPTSHVYYAQQIYLLPGELNAEALEEAWGRVINRHSALRISFQWEGLDKPVQLVHKNVSLSLERHDWRGRPTEGQEEELEAFLEKERSRSLELSEAPLLRLVLIRTAEATHQLVLSYPHLILDGWSLSSIFKEVCSFYNAICQGCDLALEASRPYGDYIAWLQEQDYSKAESFWRQELKGLIAPTLVNGGRAPGRCFSQLSNSSRERFQLSTTLTAKLRSMSRQHGLTVGTLLQGAWGLLLSRLNGVDDVLFGVTVSGRPAELRGVESMIGPFINTQPFRIRIPRNVKVLSWLQELQARQVEMRQYEYSPLVEIHGWSEVPRSSPLFDSILVFEPYSVNALLQKQANEQAAGLEITRGPGFGQLNYPLTACLTERADILVGNLDYDGELFDAVTITRMTRHFQTLLEGMVAAPELDVSAVPLITDIERHQVAVEWNDTRTGYPRDQCMHRLFEAQVERTPDATAIVFGEEHLTYTELNQSANRLGHYLMDLGVGPEVRVGICVPRTLQMVVGVFAVLKAGGVYVPVNATDSRERLAFMLEDSGVRVLLTERQLKLEIPDPGIQMVFLDADREMYAAQSPANPNPPVTSGNLAYVIYTSGSTGRPKGVGIEHRSATTLLYWARDVYTSEDLAGVLASTSICFDCSIFELYATLSWGGRVILAENDLHLPSLPSAQQVTLLSMAPSTLSTLLKVGGVPSSVRAVNLGGESSPDELVQQLNEQDIIQRIIHVYGPTEDTTYSTCSFIWPSAGGRLPIGRPIADTSVYILDRYGNPVPIGYAGELYIGGAGLARGYLNRPELTAEMFIPNDRSREPGARLYRTGDSTRYLRDGNIAFLGRLDHQIKIRGFRVELGEIESAIRRHDAIEEAVVVVVEETPGDKHLVAYVVPHRDQRSSVGDLRGFLKNYLPEYMVPSWFVMLDELPRTSHGKMDRKALPAPKGLCPIPITAFVSPGTKVERLIASIWQDMLHTDKVGIHDNFFDLGGHSLHMIQVHSKLREAFETDISLLEMFQYSTVASLAQYLNRKRDRPQVDKPAGDNRGKLRKNLVERQKQSGERRQATRKRQGV
jgi:amino acid adenylation domain-containing protein